MIIKVINTIENTDFTPGALQYVGGYQVPGPLFNADLTPNDPIFPDQSTPNDPLFPLWYQILYINCKFLRAF